MKAEQNKEREPAAQLKLRFAPHNTLHVFISVEDASWGKYLYIAE